MQTAAGRIEAEYIVCRRRAVGAIVLGQMVGMNLPMTPCQHLYARTSPVPELKGETEEVRHPVVRYQDQDMYFRQHGEGYGFGSYAHDPLIVFADQLRKDESTGPVSDRLKITSKSRAAACQRTHPVHGKVATWENTSTAVSPSPPTATPSSACTRCARNFIVAEAVWVTHAGGVGRAVANLLVHGEPGLDMRELDVNRFQPHTASRAYLRSRAERQYIEVYDIIHPLQQMENPRALRVGALLPAAQGAGRGVL